MSPLDRAVLAERGLAVRRHLARVREKLPATPDDLTADTDGSDAVILHLWQATQIAIDLAVSASVALGAGRRRRMATRSSAWLLPASLVPNSAHGW